MTDAELEEAKRLCESLTDGDWYASEHGPNNPNWFVGGVSGGTKSHMTEGDARFIAASRQLVPRLITALESARRERDVWKERDHRSNVTLKLVLEQRDEAEQARDEYKEQRDCAARAASRSHTLLTACAIRERETAEAIAAWLIRELLNDSPAAIAAIAADIRAGAWRTTRGDAGK